jgi:hypothetical protein
MEARKEEVVVNMSIQVFAMDSAGTILDSENFSLASIVALVKFCFCRANSS